MLQALLLPSGEGAQVSFSFLLLAAPHSHAAPLTLCHRVHYFALIRNRLFQAIGRQVLQELSLHLDESLDPTILLSRLLKEGKLEEASNKALSLSDVAAVSCYCMQLY